MRLHVVDKLIGILLRREEQQQQQQQQQQQTLNVTTGKSQ